GAILADAFFGKFKVVLWLSIVYCLGHATLALMGSSVAHLIEPRYLLALGLIMIAMGAGGIKPCVSTNVGDQFGETNKHLLPKLLTGSTFPLTRVRRFRPCSFHGYWNHGTRRRDSSRGGLRSP